METISAVAEMRSTLSSLSGTPVWSLTTAETESALVEVTRLEAQVAHLRARLLSHATTVDVGTAVGATSPAHWLAHETRTTRPVVLRASRLAASLEEHPGVDDAPATAAINEQQAVVIVEAVDALPDGAPVERAEAFMLAEASHHDAKGLRIIGRRLLEVIDPDAADAEEARRLEAEEVAARTAASFTIADDGHGQCHGRFTLPSLHGAMLRDALVQLAGPPPTKHRLGEAFMTLIEDRVETTVVVTMTAESLMGGLKAAGLHDGTRLSAGEARRLACTAGIIPVVLGGPSEPLDVGRQRRFHTKAQRTALAIRDGGCSAFGCDRPPSMCHAHHDKAWAQGGDTSLKNGRLLCSRHHTLAHTTKTVVMRT